MGDVAEDPFQEEQKTLQQYSKALNVYNDAETDFGTLAVNASDEFEVSYRFGLGAVHFPGAIKYTKDTVKYDFIRQLHLSSARPDVLGKDVGCILGLGGLRAGLLIGDACLEARLNTLGAGLFGLD